MKNKVKKKWDSLSDGVQKAAKFLGAVATIVGVLIGFGTWIVAQITTTLDQHISAQTAQIEANIDYLFKKTDKHEGESELTFKRIELMMLMQYNPENTAEIEKVAHSYFNAGGNSYIMSLYSKWCKQYGGDCSIMLK